MKSSAVLLFFSYLLTVCSSNVFDRSITAFTRGGGSQPTKTTERKTFKLIQVQIIHRHGDRTPITPLVEREFWESTLPSESLLDKVAEKTKIIRENNENVQAHAAGGIGPFGKLTQLGLLQMVKVGEEIRSSLHLDDTHYHESEEVHSIDRHGHVHINNGCLFTNSNPIHPSKLKITSTDFPRTIQSVQGLLLGLFPDGYDGIIEIDARHTDIMIPDPQPRLSEEQVHLERVLSQRSHLLEREKELEGIAVKVSEMLHHLIDHNAPSQNWGIGEEKDAQQNVEIQNTNGKKLTFSQLSEVMTCLKVRNMLPEGINDSDYQIITSHSAWKWFENLRNQELAKLAMKPFLTLITKTMQQGIINHDNEPIMHIYSCHDSSLIGLICALKLEQPAKWPEYGSFLKVELFECHNQISEEENDDDDEHYYVRFSLNGDILKSSWGIGRDGYPEAAEMISLKHLTSSIEDEHNSHKK
jgi:acid phosphatase